MNLVIKLKLVTDQESDDLLREVTEQYRLACNHISDVAFITRVFDRFDLQHIVYYDAKEWFLLPAQLVVRAIAEVCSAYKSLMTQVTHHNATCKPEDRRELTRIEFGYNLALPYDPRILMVDTEGMRVSLRTLHTRIWLAFKFSQDPKRQALLAKIKGQADLKRYGKKWYLIQTLDMPEAEPIDPTNHIGVDVGIARVATAMDGSDTLRFDGARIREVREHHHQLRRGLQRHNTKSSRRRVRTLQNKESRVVRDYNHLISRRIVDQAKRTNSTITLEDLDGIREGVKVRKGQRRERFSWAYAQLIGFIVYKAQLLGVPVMFVPPDYTSKTCSECHYMHDRNRQSQAWFACQECGFCWNADDNAAINIRFLGVESTHHERPVCMQEYLHTDRRKPCRFIGCGS